MHDDKELPVLSAIVRNGNESIIQSTRLGHEVLDELEAMRRDCEGAGLRPSGTAFDLRPGRGDGSVVHLLAEAQTPTNLDDPVPEREPVIAPLVERLGARSSARPLDAAPIARSTLSDDAGTRDEDGALARLVNEIVDRHCDAMRRDLMDLLALARKR